MKKKVLSLLVVSVMAIAMVACGNKEVATEPQDTQVEETAEETVAEEAPTEDTEETAEATGIDLEDGIYTVDFDTDSGMFHVNEALNGKGTLTVENGEATVHISLAGTGILNLYVGVAADAESDEANWLQHTEDEVEYEDGTTETVYGFDIPVQALDTEFDVALIGTKGTWYDHKVSVSNPIPVEE